MVCPTTIRHKRTVFGSSTQINILVDNSRVQPHTAHGVMLTAKI